MKTTFDMATGRRDWIMDRWYQKTIYVAGIIFTIIFLSGFLVGLIDELN